MLGLLVEGNGGAVLTRATRYALALYFQVGHSPLGCARKFGCTKREAEATIRWVSLRMRRRGWKP
jgi:hypothetical protein